MGGRPANFSGTVGPDGWPPARSTEDGRLRAATVVIQYTTVRSSRFLEHGQRPPYADSVGRAPAAPVSA
jgi:hypothetical protein